VSPYAKDKKKILINSISSIFFLFLIFLLVSAIFTDDSDNLPGEASAESQLSFIFSPELNDIEVETIGDYSNYEITGEGLELSLPFGAEFGLNINFDKKRDLSQSQIVVALAEPSDSFKNKVILRDVNFFSNANNPIEINYKDCPKELQEDCIKVKINLNRDVQNPRFSLHRIKQIRLFFSQNNKENLKLLIKGISIAGKDS
jgi:hypothetical protein